MKTLKVDHPWIDDSFYKKGSFLVIDQGLNILLLKNGAFEDYEKNSLEETITIYCKSFYEDKFSYHQSNNYLKTSVSELLSQIIEQDIDVKINPEQNWDQTFQEDFLNLKTKMPKDIQKVVLVSRENYSVSDSLALRKHLLAKALQMKNSKAYGFWNNEYGIIGSTPETLFEIKDGILTTEALAGTAPAGSEADLLASIKDGDEHKIVIQDLSEKLYSLGLFAEISKTVTSQFSKMIHLRTTISAVLNKKISAKVLSEALSPTAALGGYPKQKAKDFLMSTNYKKNFPLRYFGSVIGTDFDHPTGLVMIRNIQWDKDQFYIESGAGIVQQSELQKELKEIQLKRSVVRDHYL